MSLFAYLQVFGLLMASRGRALVLIDVDVEEDVLVVEVVFRIESQHWNVFVVDYLFEQKLRTELMWLRLWIECVLRWIYYCHELIHYDEKLAAFCDGHRVVLRIHHCGLPGARVWQYAWQGKHGMIMLVVYSLT